MFITFEGIDGSGKSTQIKLLEQNLKGLGYDVLLIREPGGTAVSENIRNILLDKRKNISILTELFLFEAARAELTEKVIIPALDRSQIVICDRYFDSTTAYQAYGRGLDLEMVINCNRLATLGLIPDITFYLAVTLIKAKERTDNKIQDRMESSGNDFFNLVINGFEKIARNEPERIVKINADDSIDNIHQQISNLTLERLNR